MEYSSLISHAILLKSLFIFLHFTTTYLSNCQACSNNYTQFIKTSCNTTLYPQLCYKSLSKFAEKIESNPKLLANTSISIALSEAKSTFMAMKNISRTENISGREAAALRDCLEESSDSIYQFQRSVNQMNIADEKDPNFVFEISNVQTWVSAALTDFDTCLDGFVDVKDGNVKAKVRRSVVNVSHLISIALTFINNYAAVR